MSARSSSSWRQLALALGQDLGIGDATAPQDGAAVVDARFHRGLLAAQVLDLDVVGLALVLEDAVGADDHAGRTSLARAATTRFSQRSKNQFPRR